MVRLSRIELATKFLRIFEFLYLENSTKSREFIDTEAVSRRICDVSRMWNQFWNLRKKWKWKVVRLGRIGIATKFLRIFEFLYLENLIKFREFIDIEVVSRRICDVSKMWNQFWNLRKKWKWKVVRLGRIGIATKYIRIFEFLYLENLIKFWEFCDIEIFFRWIIDVSKI